MPRRTTTIGANPLDATPTPSVARPQAGVPPTLRAPDPSPSSLYAAWLRAGEAGLTVVIDAQNAALTAIQQLVDAAEVSQRAALLRWLAVTRDTQRVILAAFHTGGPVNDQ